MSAPALCRDCFAAREADRRCRVCGSPRLVRHPELHALPIGHVDCDAFFATIEKRDDPSLADRPVIVGGGRRGVVAAACYVARSFGVRSAMPMFKALAACPHAVVIRPDLEKYVAAARQVRAIMAELTPMVEPVSIDEAYLDLSGTERAHGASPAATLARFSKRVEAELGVTISVGLSYCKFLAKIASDLDKPRGFAVIGRAEAMAFLALQPIGLFQGVGAVMQKRLAADGFVRVEDLQRAAASDLARRYGEEGLRLWRLARGDDPRRIDPSRETKSVSAETTFSTDLDDPRALERKLYALCEKVAARLAEKELGAQSVSLKLKASDFRVLTRAARLTAPTLVAARLFQAARPLLAAEANGRLFRLIGLAATDLSPASQADRGDLVDESAPKQRARQAAINALRAKFGRTAIVPGILFEPTDRD